MRYLYQNTELTIKHIKLIHAYRKVSDQTIDTLLGLRLFNDPEEILSKPAFAVISAGLTERAASHGCSMKGRATCEARVPRFRLACVFGRSVFCL